MEDLAKLQDIVTRLLVEKFSTAISKVSVQRDVDCDGDAILRISIVLSNNVPIDKKKFVGFARHLRGRLFEERQVNEFPVISFVSKSESRKFQVEAA